MNFAKILDEWDRLAPEKGGYSKDEDTQEASRKNNRQRLLNKKPDAVIDLHGLTQDEAWDTLDAFFTESRLRGLEKVLVIHGKGSHSKSEGVLRDLCRQFIERCPYAGTSGQSSASQGGSGATWVLLKA